MNLLHRNVFVFEYNKLFILLQTYTFNLEESPCSSGEVEVTKNKAWFPLISAFDHDFRWFLHLIMGGFHQQRVAPYLHDLLLKKGRWDTVEYENVQYRFFPVICIHLSAE